MNKLQPRYLVMRVHTDDAGFSDAKYCIVELTMEYLQSLLAKQEKARAMGEPCWCEFNDDQSVYIMNPSDERNPDRDDEGAEYEDAPDELKLFLDDISDEVVVTDLDLSDDTLNRFGLIIPIESSHTKFYSGDKNPQCLFVMYEDYSYLQVKSDMILINDLIDELRDSYDDFVMYSETEVNEYGEPLYWSNCDGWVWPSSCATMFSMEEKRTVNLPIGATGWMSIAEAESHDKFLLA